MAINIKRDETVALMQRSLREMCRELQIVQRDTAGLLREDIGEYAANLTLARRHLEDAVSRIDAAKRIVVLRYAGGATQA